MNEGMDHSSVSAAVTMSPIEITANYHVTSVVDLSEYRLHVLPSQNYEVSGSATGSIFF